MNYLNRDIKIYDRSTRPGVLGVNGIQAVPDSVPLFRGEGFYNPFVLVLIPGCGMDTGPDTLSRGLHGARARSGFIGYIGVGRGIVDDCGRLEISTGYGKENR